MAPTFPICFLGISPSPRHVMARLDEAKAVWTDQGWVVPGNLYFNSLNLEALPTIKKVGGSFSCSHNRLQTLQGCPEEIGGGFFCRDNPLPKEEIEAFKKSHPGKVAKF